MHGLKNEHNINLSTSRWTAAMRSVMAEKVREANAHSPRRWAAGPTNSFNQQTFGYDVAARSIAAV